VIKVKRKVINLSYIESEINRIIEIAEAKKLGFKHAIAPATIHDKFVIPVKDLRTTLIKYVNE